MNLTEENYCKKLISYVMEHLGGEIGRERQRRRRRSRESRGNQDDGREREAEEERVEEPKRR